MDLLTESGETSTTALLKLLVELRETEYKRMHPPEFDDLEALALLSSCAIGVDVEKAYGLIYYSI